MSYSVVNQDISFSGIYRAKVYVKNDSATVYVPGLSSIKISENNELTSETYENHKKNLPKGLFLSMDMKETIERDKWHTCWVMFENGDGKRPIITGYFGKIPEGIKQATMINTSNYTRANNTTTRRINITGVGEILLVAGHGNGDPGAKSDTYEEAELTREVVALLSDKINCDVYDTAKDMYNDLMGDDATNYLKNYKVVMEIHFNKHDGQAQGTELLVSNTSQPTNIESAILNALTSVGFTNRGYKDGNELRNMDKAKTAGVENYFLVEVCFIDSVTDMSLYQEKKNDIIENMKNAINDIIESSKRNDSTGPVNLDTLIMGNSAATAEKMFTYLQSKNTNLLDYCTLDFCKMYLTEGEAEGVRGDIAFAQSCLETGYFTFKGAVSSTQYNFAGLGATGNGVSGLSFESPQIGIRAQIQHLKAYASTDNLNQDCVDPRFSYVNPRGKAPTIGELTNKWDVGNAEYSSTIVKILNEILAL